MNAPIRKFAAVLSVVVATTALTACVGAFDPETDPTSPVAPRVQALVDANREYPRWADFPKSPEPEPAPALIAARVATLETTGGELAQAVASPVDSHSIRAGDRANGGRDRGIRPPHP